MTTDENGYPLITLPGSLTWEAGYRFGQTLDVAFPGQCGYDLASAMEYNDCGPVNETNGIVDLVMIKEGERDAEEWVWQVSMQDGTDWVATGWCDYTGWDCQSGLSWSRP